MEKSKLFKQIEEEVIYNITNLPFKFSGVELLSAEYAKPKIIRKDGKKIAIYNQTEKKILSIIYQVLYKAVDKNWSCPYLCVNLI